MKVTVVLAVLFCLSGVLFSQQHSGTWQRSEEKDPFSDIEYSQFVLFGRYLTTPTDQTAAQPHLVVQCQRTNNRAYHGKVLHAYLAAGALVHERIDQKVLVELRLDDGKPQDDYWMPSTSLQGIFFETTTLSNLLYGHMIPHKENSSPPIRKVLLQFDEALAGKVVVQFDMPDPSEIAEACGVITHR